MSPVANTAKDKATLKKEETNQLHKVPLSLTACAAVRVVIYR